MGEPRLRDQRDIYPSKPTSVDGVRDFWADWAARHGLTLVADDRTVEAYVNHGRWVAECPECNGGIACWDQNPAGCCLDCGHVYAVGFPAQAAAAAKRLLKRGKAANRNWRPADETTATLDRENTLMLNHVKREADLFRKAKAHGKGEAR